MGDKATVIGILPTADAPASTTIEWSGYVRAAIVYNCYDNGGTWRRSDLHDDDDSDVYARGQLKVVGKTDTAVGEVGVQMRFVADFDGLASIHFERHGIDERSLGLVGNDPGTDAWWRLHGFARQHRLWL